MRDSRFVKTPASPSLVATIIEPDDLNVATVIANDTARQEFPPSEIPYNEITDEGLASRRSKHVVRTHAEVKAAYTGELPSGDGLSCRAPMAGQCENDQWPWSTNRYGKQRS